MFYKSAILDTHDVDYYPIHGLSDSRKPTMEHDEFTIGDR